MQAPAALVNHLLRGDAWAGSQFKDHLGKSFRFGLPPFQLAMRINSEGEFEPVMEAPENFDLELTLPPSALPLLFAGLNELQRAVIVKGDAEFARSLQELAQAMPWVLERELSRWVGPILAQRVIGVVRGLASWPNYAGERLGSSVASFLVEERPTLVKRADFEDMGKSVGTLRDAVARLEKRLELIASTPSPP